MNLEESDALCWIGVSSNAHDDTQDYTPRRGPNRRGDPVGGTGTKTSVSLDVVLFGTCGMHHARPRLACGADVGSITLVRRTLPVGTLAGNELRLKGRRQARAIPTEPAALPWNGSSPLA